MIPAQVVRARLMLKRADALVGVHLAFSHSAVSGVWGPGSAWQPGTGSPVLCSHIELICAAPAL